MSDEASEILNLDESDGSGEIKESPDGLQFVHSIPDSDLESSVGFSKEGHLSYKGDFKNGKPEGLWTTYFPDGKPRWQGRKENGNSHGPFTIWYENGRKKLQGTYHHGMKHGIITAWHKNGIRWQTKGYANGKPSGIWKTWDEEGNLISEISQNENSDANSILDIND